MSDIRSMSDLRAERNELQWRTDEFLRACGWKHTSDTPGSYVLWEREFRGRVLLVDEKMALSMQAAYFDDPDEFCETHFNHTNHDGSCADCGKTKP